MSSVMPNTEADETRATGSPASAPSRPPPPVRPFGEAEQLLLQEARARFDFEQKSSGVLHSKSTLYVTLTVAFVALDAASIARLLDRGPASFELASLIVLALSLALLMITAVHLSRSAISTAYSIVATPAEWVRYLDRLQHAFNGYDYKDAQVFARLQHDLLDAWVEACEACFAANEEKAASLETVQRLLTVALPAAVIGILLLLGDSVLD